MDTNDNDLDLLEEYDEIEEEDDKDDKILQIPMDDFAGDIDLSEMNINLRHNLEQARKRRQESRQNLGENVRGFVYTVMGWIGNQIGYNKDAVDELISKQYLETLFKELDKDGGGSIDRKELYDGFIARGAGDKFTDKEILQIINFMDKDGDGEIDFQEFIDMFGYMKIQSMDDLIEKSYLYILFASVDDDGSGSIDFEEFKGFLVDNGIKMSDAEVERLMKQVDEDGDGNMDFYEFYSIFSAVKSFDDLIVSSRLHIIFNSIDTDGSGELEFEEIKQLFKQEKIEMSDKELKAMMAKIDENGDGVIDFEEFETAFGMITDLQDLVNIWQNLNSIDVGSDLSIGSGLSKLAWLPIVAGGCGGIMSKTCTAPLERAKLLAQTGKYSGSMMKTFSQIIERQGFWRGLWKGNFYGCLRIFPFAGCVTFTYTMFLRHVVPQQYRERINNPKDPATNFWRFTAGLTAGCVATTITYPLDLMKAHEATDMTQTKGLVKKPKEFTFLRRLKIAISPSTISANFKKEMKENNIRTFRDAFRGLVPTIFAVPCFVGFQNMSYDFFRIYLTSEDHMDLQPSVELFAACGCMAGITAQSIVYPMDVIRRRIQTETMWPDPNVTNVSEMWKDNIKQPRQSTRWMNGIINMIRQQGIKPLFAGLAPTYLKVMPSVAISVTTRDILLGRLNKD